MTSRFTLDAEYIQGGQGLWLLTHWRAANNSTALLILPPFAEEMNCCRRVFATLATMLVTTDTAATSGKGIDCFLPDFYGTGDSEGDFHNISLQQWRQDVLSFLPQLAGYQQVHVLGCRFGAALLLDWLSDIRQILPFGQVMLWQPQLDARRFWQQLQRLQQFGEPGGQADASAANTATIPAETLYVAGYEIPLSLQSEALALNSQLPADVSQLYWFESTLSGQLSPASLKLQQNHPELLMQALNGQPYWLSQEPVDNQALLDATVAVLRGFAAKSSPTSKAKSVTPAITRSIATVITANITAPQIIPLQLCGKQSLGIYLAAASDLLIVMVNGGAQTKAGSHRMQQQLAWHWQQAGFASLRFDFPGFGDAEGSAGDFIDHARYLTALPAELQRVFGKRRPVVLFGLCDGATAALLASHVLQPDALLLLNPWCRLQQNHARTMLKFYYLQRLVSKEFWQKLLTGRLKLTTSIASLQRFLQASAAEHHFDQQTTEKLAEPDSKPHGLPALSPDQAVLQAIERWQSMSVPVHLTLSSADLTAAECAELLKRADLQHLREQADCLEIAGANHTLSGEGHLAVLMQASVNFLRRLAA
ncbi:alpha/beta fold hydrolase [Rheinheimera texasensis]|uniref:alpha/beta fold hydrolase n=1 Tax=Rheinheimera texasensis TaxID=306205 RepID=UPI000691BD05|nr:alpha/beta fold hydrolase [Rheinheimera texasensis]